MWFQNADKDGQFPTWDDFTQALLVRFGPAYDDPMESLVKLSQSSTMAEYTSQFKSLPNLLRGLSNKYKLSCFLTGLKDEICLPLQISPRNLVAAFGLPKLHEEYLVSGRKPFKPQLPSTSYSRQSTWSQQAASPSLSSGAPNSSFSSRPNPAIIIQRISPAQMCERREKGLCYNGDERWYQAHVCKSPKLYLLHAHEFTTEDSEDCPSVEIVEPVEPMTEPLIQEVVEPEISLHAISGFVAPKTMRLVGWIRNHRVVISLTLVVPTISLI